jgi:hypothetical protein
MLYPESGFVVIEVKHHLQYCKLARFFNREIICVAVYQVRKLVLLNKFANQNGYAVFIGTELAQYRKLARDAVSKPEAVLTDATLEMGSGISFMSFSPSAVGPPRGPRHVVCSWDAELYHRCESYEEPTARACADSLYKP